MPTVIGGSSHPVFVTNDNVGRPVINGASQPVHVTNFADVPVSENYFLLFLFIFNGTMDANRNVRVVVPFNCRIHSVSAVTVNNSDATFILGTSTDTDNILTTKPFGDSNTPVLYTASDFAVTNQTGELDAGQIAVLTIDYDGASGTAAADSFLAVWAVRT